MKRSTFDEEEGEDPSIAPADGSSPIGTLGHDLIYKLFVTSGQSVRDLRRLCSVDRRFRDACANEYIWRKLYFLKVVKSPGLAEMEEPEARQYIDRVLMQTPEGVQWTAQQGFAQTPYILLIAFAWLNVALFERALDVTYRGGTVHGTPKVIRLTHPEDGSRIEIFLSNYQGKMGLFAQGSEDLLRRVGFSNIQRDHRGIHFAIIPYTHYIFFFCRIIELGTLPAVAPRYYPRTPDALLESCLSCRSPAPLVQCGAACGQARYCDQSCANAHWNEHQKDCCCSNQSL